MAAKWLIGIDLGTTNCTMAYASLDTDEHQGPEPQQFAIPQIISSGMQDAQTSLPSFLYFPLDEELKQKAAAIDWAPERERSVGLYARERASEVPDRVIASAKSWLCHDKVNRRDPLLPAAAADEAQKLSPVAACSELLVHLKEAWDQVHAEDAPFLEQRVLVTVPASFDPSARQLVEEAAEAAGYPECILLEEPQAAFYAWLQKHNDNWRDLLAVGDRVLVIDVGGGTTDFSLIGVEEEGGDLALNRIAVGQHLLLGGDNMDHALAYLARQKLEDDGQDLDEWQFQSLIYACRAAKEQLLSADAPENVDITIPGRGSGFVAGTLTTTVSQEEASALLLDGFAPVVGAEDQAVVDGRGGLQQVGLPYAQDARITAQLANFLSMSGDKSLDSFVMPTAVLFNGGTMRAQALQERIMEQLAEWAKALKVDAPKVLPDADCDFAVSRGAVYYGFAREGKAIRIRGGASRSYFIGVEEAVPAVPGMPTPIRAICVVPFGMEEGTEAELEEQEFSLLVGEHAVFRFFSCSTPQLPDGSEPSIGSTLRKWKQLTELHPIETVLDSASVDEKVVHVKLKSKITELGVLELWCVAGDGRQWKLEFDLREPKEALAAV